MTQTCETVDISVPVYPLGGSDVCQRDSDSGRSIYHNSRTAVQLQQAHLDRYETEFNRIMGGTSSSRDKHMKINCLLQALLGDIRTNYNKYENGLSELQAQLASEKNHVAEQEKILKSNEDSDLVTKYRNENSAKRNKEMSTKFTIYVTMIVIFLIVEGIVFFV